MSPMPSMRCAILAASNSSKSSRCSPTPTSLIGTPVAALTARAAPPRASPSSLVNITPVIPAFSLKACATLTPSCPVMASTTSKTSCGFNNLCIRSSSDMRSSSTCKRPAVSKIITSMRRESAYVKALLATSNTLLEPASSGPKNGTPAFSAKTLSCFTAAGRRKSQATTMGLWLSDILKASFTAVVVLPEPCNPTSVNIDGGLGAKFNLSLLPPMRLQSSSYTTA